MELTKTDVSNIIFSLLASIGRLLQSALLIGVFGRPEGLTSQHPIVSEAFKFGDVGGIDAETTVVEGNSIAVPFLVAIIPGNPGLLVLLMGLPDFLQERMHHTLFTILPTLIFGVQALTPLRLRQVQLMMVCFPGRNII